jgi:serine/threonine protein kinase
MDSRSVLARFEAERQALAMMDHANVAKVLDGGLTETGRPFFVMEYVKGVPITEYCDAGRLSVPERLHLFMQVCQAVQHAHQKGIIHRDLKPSNILVAPYDDKPVPKIIDFGLAKALHQSLTDKTLHTAHESVLGTPLYMSPEQAQLNNLDVDTRSDIYSLGVLLYELLTGTTPLERKRFKEAAWDEVRRIIREEEPLRPSARLSSTDTLPSLAACRHTEPLKLTKQVRGDLDWIVMKALEKERTRRYETASGFATDVQRYLSGEPVLAVPPSARYRLRKFVRRNKGRMLATAALALTAFAGTSAVVSVQAKANRNLAVANKQLRQANERERQRFDLAMEAVGLFHGEVSQDLLLKEKQFERLRNKLLKGAAGFYDKLEQLLKDQDDPESRATLGKAYHELGLLTSKIGDQRTALATFGKALAVRRKLAVRPDARAEEVSDLARTLLEFGKTQPDLGERESSKATLSEALAVADQAETRFGPSEASRALRASLYQTLGRNLDTAATYEESMAANEQARAILEALVEAHPSNQSYQRDLADTYDGIAIDLLLRGKLPEAQAESRKARLLWLAATSDPSDVEGQAALARSYGNEGANLARVGLLAEGLEALEAEMAIHKRLLEVYPAVTSFREQSSVFGMCLGEALRKLGRAGEARAVLERSKDVHERLVAGDPATVFYRHWLAAIRTCLGDLARVTDRPDEARAEYIQAVAMNEELLNSTKDLSHGWEIAGNLRRLALLDASAARFAEAAAASKRAIALCEAEAPQWNWLLFNFACCRATLAGLAGKAGSGLPAADGPAEADKAMALLHKAVATGYRNLHDLRTDAGLNPLRQRDDFKKLLADVELKNHSNATSSTMLAK